MKLIAEIFAVIGALLIGQLICFYIYYGNKGGNDGLIGLGAVSLLGGLVGAGCFVIAGIMAFFI